MFSSPTYNFRTLVVDYDLNSFFDVERFARRFIENTVLNVLKIIGGMDDAPTKEERRKAIVSRSLSHSGIEWPTCGSINTKNAFNSLQNEMRAWNDMPELKDWMFSIEFINLLGMYRKDFYKYEVIWSIPTAAYPEPQVTVSVYFIIAVDLNHPRHYPVDVTYTFEIHQLVHRLDMIFQPKWLYDILDLKTMVFKSFKV